MGFRDNLDAVTDEIRLYEAHLETESRTHDGLQSKEIYR